MWTGQEEFFESKESESDGMINGQTVPDQKSYHEKSFVKPVLNWMKNYTQSRTFKNWLYSADI